MHAEPLDDRLSGKDLIGEAHCMSQEYFALLDVAGQYTAYNRASSKKGSADQWPQSLSLSAQAPGCCLMIAEKRKLFFFFSL